MGRGSYYADYVFFLLGGWGRGMEPARVADDLIDAYQKIPHRSVKTPFRGEAGTAVRLGRKPRFPDLAWLK